MKNTRSLFSLILTLLTIQGFSQTTSWKGTASTYWNLPANWTNGIPSPTKDVIIGDANFTGTFQPKVNVAAECQSVTIGGLRGATLTLTRTLKMHGNLMINPNGILEHPNATAYLSGNLVNNGGYRAIATGSRLILNGISQTISGSSLTIFRRLTVNAGCTFNLGNNIRVDSTGSLLAVYGIIDPGASPGYSVTSSGLSRIYDKGKIKVYGATFASNYIFTGVTTLYGGSIVEYASPSADQVISSAYAYSTLLISGGGTKSLAANLLPIYSKDIVNGKIAVTGGTFDLRGFTANRGVTKVGGTLSIDPGARMKIGGLNNFPVNFATRLMDVASTVEYNGVDQTISAQNYGNLALSTTGIKTAVTAFNVMGNLSMNNATLNTNAVVVNHNIAGDVTVAGGAFTGTNSTYTLNGSSNQDLQLGIAISKLIINKTGGDVNLRSHAIISNSLNFNKGVIRTGMYSVVMSPSASIVGAGETTGWVCGNLQKNIVTGTGVSKTYEVGDIHYSPTTVTFASVSIAGELTAAATSADQPEIDYSGINPAKSVNRFWSFTNAGILFSTANVIFNWIGSDTDAGTATGNFKTALFNGSNWQPIPSTAALPTSIQASGLTSLGDFAIGEKIGRSTWTGNAMSADWFTPKNWLGLIPSVTDPTLVPNNLLPGRVYPILATGSGIVQDLTVENSASVTVSNGSLRVGGTISSAGRVNTSQGTIEFNGATPQVIASSAFTSGTIKNLVINNNVSLSDLCTITGTVTIGNAQTLTTNDNLLLRSDANGTARVATLPTDGAGNATAFVNGRVTIERYIPARKAWRLLSAPIKPGPTATLADAWQEGAYVNSVIANPNPHPGYGFHIVGGTTAQGFDQSLTNSPTVKVYNNVTNTFVGLPTTTGTFAPLKNYTGYLVYIRGDRGIDLSQGTNAATTATTLRMSGAINTGKQVSTVNAANFTVLGNPFPSAIDFGTISKTNVKNSFYIWDPKLGGANGLGAYVTVSWNSATSTYDITTAASAISQYIPSGEAVLVESLDGTNVGSISIRESDKTANGTDALFGRNSNNAQSLRCNLYAKKSSGEYELLDGALTTYSDLNSNNLDVDDVAKIVGGTESVGFLRDSKNLAIERRKIIAATDTAFLQTTVSKTQQYKLELISTNLDGTGLTALLQDSYDPAINNTVLNTNGTTEIAFSINNDAASFNKNRFRIIFRESKPQPFTFVSVKAVQQERNISLAFQAKNESDIKTYLVEASEDGTNFSTVSQITGKAMQSGIDSYSWFDLNVSEATHYYRVRAANRNGSSVYSGIVKVALNDMPVITAQLLLYPNPVKTSAASIQAGKLSEGRYDLELSNLNGQLIKTVSVQHPGGDLKYNFVCPAGLPAGKYQLTLSGPATKLTTSLIKE